MFGPGAPARTRTASLCRSAPPLSPEPAGWILPAAGFAGLAAALGLWPKRELAARRTSGLLTTSLIPLAHLGLRSIDAATVTPAKAAGPESRRHSGRITSPRAAPRLSDYRNNRELSGIIGGICIYHQRPAHPSALAEAARDLRPRLPAAGHGGVAVGVAVTHACFPPETRSAFPLSPGRRGLSGSACIRARLAPDYR